MKLKKVLKRMIRNKRNKDSFSEQNDRKEFKAIFDKTGVSGTFKYNGYKFLSVKVSGGIGAMGEHPGCMNLYILHDFKK